MRFLICNGSLKGDGESNTFKVSKMLQTAFNMLGHECELVTLRDLNYEGSTDEVNDELQPVIKKMLEMDGVVFATPIWWGVHSCHIQALMERLEPIYSWAKDNNYQPFYNKVFGSLVSGGGDGFQHIHGILYSFASNFGFTIPPQCNIESRAQGTANIVKDDDTYEQVKNCATNMVVWAQILRENQPTIKARHGSVDINESNLANADLARKFNDYGISAKHLQGRFYAYKDGKMTGGPFDTIDQLQAHQQEILDKMDSKDED